MKSTPRTVAAYLRISKDDETSSSIEKQRAEVERWVAANAPDAVVSWYADEGVSGSKDVKRPQRDALEACLGDFDALAFYSADRLARSVVDLHRIVERAAKVGTKVVSVTQPMIDTTTAQGRAFLGLLAVFAALEADTTSERVRATNDLVRSKGRRANGGPAGFGFRRRLDGGMEPDPETAPLVLAAVESLLDGSGSIRATARAWQGVRPSPRGSEWTDRTVSKILRSPALAGFVVDRTTSGGLLVGDDGLPVRDAEAAILSIEKRTALIAVLDSRRRTSVRKGTAEPTLLDRVRVECQHGHKAYRRAASGSGVPILETSAPSCSLSISQAALSAYVVARALDLVGENTEIVRRTVSSRGADAERLVALRAERSRLSSLLAIADPSQVAEIAGRIAGLAAQEAEEAAHEETASVAFSGETFGDVLRDPERVEESAGILAGMVARIVVAPGARGGRDLRCRRLRRAPERRLPDPRP